MKSGLGYELGGPLGLSLSVYRSLLMGVPRASNLFRQYPLAF